MRHRVQSKKFNRSSNHRQALFKNLVKALVVNRELTTTEAKAKVVRQLADKMISKAKKGTLHSRRLIHAFFNSKQVTATLIDQMVPQMKHRSSGYTKLVRVGYRTGDNTMMAKLTFVDPIVIAEVAAKPEKTTKVTTTKTGKKDN